MSMKKSLIISLSLLTIVFFSTSSCKKCKADDTNVNTGVIVNDVIIYPSSGGLSGNLGGDYHIDGSHQYKNSFMVSFDGGLTKDSIDYSTYHILCLPMSIKCEASFVRDVTVDDANNLITYTVTAKTCSSCKEVYTVENFVLVSALPPYPIEYDPVIIED